MSTNHKNALNAVLFEAIDLILHYHTYFSPLSRTGSYGALVID
jgi:hypothetical protein